jgi:DNA-binding MltR family transcriptional regulator
VPSTRDPRSQYDGRLCARDLHVKNHVDTESLSRDTKALYDLLNDEPDLSAVVVAASFLDTALADLLSARLQQAKVAAELLSPQGALGTFGARRDLALCLGLISESHHRDLRAIARIRNRFAHSHLQLTFCDAGIQSLCDQLREWQVLLLGETEGAVASLTAEERRMRSRNQFKLTVVFIANRIILSSLGLRLTPPADSSKS